MNQTAFEAVQLLAHFHVVLDYFLSQIFVRRALLITSRIIRWVKVAYKMTSRCVAPTLEP
jgi:hypothetical protein